MQRQLEQEPECAWLKYARQELCEEDCCLEGSGSNGRGNDAVEMFLVRADSGFDRAIRLDKSADSSAQDQNCIVADVCADEGELAKGDRGC